MKAKRKTQRPIFGRTFLFISLFFLLYLVACQTNDTMKKTVETENAPSPIGPYSQAVWAGETLFLSGQIAIDPESGELMTSNVQEETKQIMKNLEGVLQEAGLNFSNVIKTSIFLSDMGQFSAVNEVYGSYFESDFPARETVEVSNLPKGVNVEISMIAVR